MPKERPDDVNEHADQGYRKLFKTLKGMSWKERWDHLIYYYGVAALIVAAVLVMATTLIIDIITPDPVYLYEGMFVNVTVSDELEEALSSDIYDMLGGTDPDMQLVAVNQFVLKDYSASMIESMYTRVYTGQIDYIITDEFAMECLAPWSVYTDLTHLLSEETLEKWKPYLVTGIGYDGSVFPIAIDISHTEFAKQCKYSGEPLFIGFPGNTGHDINAEEFLAYLMSLYDEQ